ncbi:MAG TPA: glycerol-3-phosphate dehydrogenase/oxidase [Ktedonobacteraceae bacterium]|nr:glycerol-3-phosphate dehydrogenase/oxidase [Ktedonobacteraceae bacterium]
MEPLAATARATYVERLANDQFDVLVIGGGITGAGVALDAAARGYRVALVEKADFASGTSSKSTKLAHGGIRYLPQFDFPMIQEGVVERGRLVRHAPFLVRPQPFVIPVYEHMPWPSSLPVRPKTDFGLDIVLDIGLWMYDLMAGRLNIGRHKRVSKEETLRRAPRLRQTGLKKALLYYDAQTNDAQLTVTVLRTAAQFGAVVTNYTEVIGFTNAHGKLTGAVVRDVLTKREVTVSAHHIINAAGVFAEQVAALSGDESKATIEPSKGIHLVVAKDRLGISDTAVVLPETEDGRILYVVPWQSRAIIGTTDTGSGDLDDPQASPADIAYLMKHVNQYLEVNLTDEDILSVYAGYRPLVKSRGARAAELSRTHVVLQENNGMVTIVGGKLTTYRRMAQDTVDVLAKRDGMPISHPTEKLLLTGAIGWRNVRQEIEGRSRQLGLAPESVKHLEDNFGSHASEVLDLIEEEKSLGERLVSDLPYLRAEVIYACRAEMAMTLEDVLARRTRIILEDGARGADIAPEVATLMAGELGWSREQMNAQVEQYRALVDHQLEAEGLRGMVQQ